MALELGAEIIRGERDLARQPAPAAAPTRWIPLFCSPSDTPSLLETAFRLSAPLKQPSSGPPVCLLLVYSNFDALKADVEASLNHVPDREDASIAVVTEPQNHTAALSIGADLALHKDGTKDEGNSFEDALYHQDYAGESVPPLLESPDGKPLRVICTYFASELLPPAKEKLTKAERANIKRNPGVGWCVAQDHAKCSTLAFDAIVCSEDLYMGSRAELSLRLHHLRARVWMRLAQRQLKEEPLRAGETSGKRQMDAPSAELPGPKQKQRRAPLSDEQRRERAEHLRFLERAVALTRDFRQQAGGRLQRLKTAFDSHRQRSSAGGPLTPFYEQSANDQLQQVRTWLASAQTSRVDAEYLRANQVDWLRYLYWAETCRLMRSARDLVKIQPHLVVVTQNTWREHGGSFLRTVLQAQEAQPSSFVDTEDANAVELAVEPVTRMLRPEQKALGPFEAVGLARC